MFNAVRFAQKLARQRFQVHALLLIALSSLALAGCSGLVTANNGGGGPPLPLTISGVQAATPTSSGFQVSWSTNLAANSAVDYGTTASYGSSTQTNGAMVTSHQVAVTGLASGTLYHFRARSADASNASISSGDMTFSTAADTTPPTAPTGLTATAVSSSQINLAWTASTDNVGVTGYNIFRGGVKIGTAPGTSFQDSGLSASTSYTYNVSALDAAGNTSAQSAGTSATTQGVSSGPVISGVSVGGITTSGAIVTWTTDVGATSQVEYGTTTAYGNLTTLNSSLVTSHMTSLVSLAANTLYHYRVHSKNSSGVESISGDFVFQTSSVVDTTPPTISITAPANGATVSGTVTVSANATDNVGVASVQFALDGVNLGAAVTASPYQVPWNTTTAANGSHIMGAAARDLAGNVGNAVAVTVNVSNSGTTGGVDFPTRCTAAGVVKCVAWDNASDFTPASGGSGVASGLYPADDGTYQGVQDTTNKVDGAGSLKFVIRAGSVHPHYANPAGYWLQQFGPDDAEHTFGEGSTIYLQFRVMVDSPMLTYNWPSAGGEGWKIFIVWGPVHGPSCTGDQFVQENTYQTDVATGYVSCGSPGLYTNNGNPPMLIEQGDYNCPYGGGYSSNPNCFTYPANTWLTEYWVVHIGTYGQANSTFQAWIAPDGQPLKQFIDLPNFTFGDSSDHTVGLQAIILQPYFSGANGSTSTPAATMWFDDLIISTQPIAPPNN